MKISAFSPDDYLATLSKGGFFWRQLTLRLSLSLKDSDTYSATGLRVWASKRCSGPGCCESPRCATLMPAFQPGAQPPAGGWIEAMSWPLRVSSQAITEL